MTYGRDVMAEYWRGEITLRKLRVLAEYLPEDSPAHWDKTDKKRYGLTESLLWRLLWATWQTQVIIAQVGGNKKAKMPADKMPPYPWSELKKTGARTFGSVGDRDPKEVLSYLKNL